MKYAERLNSCLQAELSEISGHMGSGWMMKEADRKMGKYEVEYALFKKITINADSLQDAKEKAHMIEDEEIERLETENTGYMVWDGPRKIL